MKRRSVIKSLVLVTGGLVLLPGCSWQEAKASIALEHLDISENEEKLLGEMVETILPTTDTPGGKAMGLHLFVLQMVDDTYSKEDLEAFVQGMEQFQKMTKQQMGYAFVALSPPQKEQMVAAVNAGNAPAEVLSFYKTLKDLSINGYLNSELVMTKLRVYELVPGRYNAYFPVKMQHLS